MEREHQLSGSIKIIFLFLTDEFTKDVKKKQ